MTLAVSEERVVVAIKGLFIPSGSLTSLAAEASSASSDCVWSSMPAGALAEFEGVVEPSAGSVGLEPLSPGLVVFAAGEEGFDPGLLPFLSAVVPPVELVPAGFCPSAVVALLLGSVLGTPVLFEL